MQLDETVQRANRLGIVVLQILRIALHELRVHRPGRIRDSSARPASNCSRRRWRSASGSARRCRCCRVLRAGSATIDLRLQVASLPFQGLSQPQPASARAAARRASEQVHGRIAAWQGDDRVLSMARAYSTRVSRRRSGMGPIQRSSATRRRSGTSGCRIARRTGARRRVGEQRAQQRGCSAHGPERCADEPATQEARRPAPGRRPRRAACGGRTRPASAARPGSARARRRRRRRSPGCRRGPGRPRCSLRHVLRQGEGAGRARSWRKLSGVSRKESACRPIAAAAKSIESAMSKPQTAAGAKLDECLAVLDADRPENLDTRRGAVLLDGAGADPAERRRGRRSHPGSAAPARPPRPRRCRCRSRRARPSDARPCRSGASG